MTAQAQIADALEACDAALKAQGLSAKRMELVGSTYIKGNGTDIDVLCLVPEADLDSVVFPGWMYGGSNVPSQSTDDGRFGSWKYDVDGTDVNMLIVTSEEYANAWLTAAEVCRFLHLAGVDLTRGAVHGVHEIIMDDSTAETEVPKRNYA